MRDQLDTKTNDLIPAKRGRPCQNPESGPKDQAERARLYRMRRKHASRKAALVAISVENLPDRKQTREELENLSTPAMVDALRSLIADGDKKHAMLVLRLIAGRVHELA